MNIYQELILDHYKHPKNFGTLSMATHKTIANNPLCGDKFAMEGTIKDNVLSDIRFSGEGCAISTASASMLTDYVKGKKISVLKKLDISFILKLIGIELSPNRLKCALLPLEGLHKLCQSKI